MFALLLALLIHQAALAQTAYYVDALNGSDANSGKSTTLAWKTVSKVNGSVFVPGDLVAFKRGETWVGGIVVPSSGTSGSPITFGAYGTGARPIITIFDSLKNGKVAGTWTQKGSSNIWKTFDSFCNISRLWLNGTETAKALNGAGVGSSTPWFFDTGTDTLYVYATSNPATFYSSIGVPFTEVNNATWTVILTNKDWLAFNNLDFQGGGNGTVQLNAADHIVFDGCNIGLWCGNEGIYGDNGGGADAYSDSCQVSNCTFNSGATIFYSNAANAQTGANDAIQVRKGARGWQIYNNSFKGWYHCDVYLYSDDATKKVQYCNVHNNRFDGSPLSYSRAFAMLGKTAGCVEYNTMAYNYAVNMTVNNEIGGDSNSVYYNVINGVRDTLTTGGAIGLSLEPAFGHGTGWCKGNKVLNNTVYNAQTAGIKITDYNDATDTIVAGNEIANNIVANCGLGLSITTHSGFVTRNTIKNNVFYKNGTTIIVDYRETLTNVAILNTEHAYGDIISGNMQVDPMFLSINDFHLQPGSPCRNAGLGVGLTMDYDGKVIPYNSHVDIGAFGISTLTTGKSGYNGKDLRSVFLAQNYPNPFNPTTSIGYNLLVPSMVTLEVFDTLGRIVETLVNQREEAGYHEVRFDGSRLASGAYLCRLKAGGFVATKRLLLLR